MESGREGQGDFVVTMPASSLLMASVLAFLGLVLCALPTRGEASAEPDSVLLRFRTSPSVALLEIRRLGGPLIVRETPCHIMLPRRERVDYTIVLAGYYTERGRMELRDVTPDTTIDLRLVPDTQMKLRVVCNPLDASIAVRDSSGHTIHESRDRAELWVRRQKVQLTGQWDSGESRLSWRDLREASGREYEVVLTPDFRQVVLNIHSYPPGTITIRPISSPSPLRAFSVLNARVDKEVVVLICTWPDGETQTETVNLRSVTGGEFHHAVWKQDGRVPVLLEAPGSDVMVTIESADGAERFTIRGGFQGTLKPVPYTIRITTGADDEAGRVLNVDPSTSSPGDTLRITL